MPKSRKKKTKKGTSHTHKPAAYRPELEHRIYGFVKASPGKNFTRKQIQKRFISQYDKDLIQKAINKLIAEDKLEKITSSVVMLAGSKTYKRTHETYEGVLDMSTKGFGFVMCPDLDRDVFVGGKNLDTALHRDQVEVRITHKAKNGKFEGEIVRIIKRTQTQFVGTVHMQGKNAIVVPDTDRMPYDIFIHEKNLNKAENGAKVIVQIKDWKNRAKMPEGKIVEAIGDAGEHDVEMKSILIENGFNINFPDEVLAAAEALPETIHESEVDNRRDMRRVTTFTIDPIDAKDFDDALSIQQLKDGKFEIGVHIADVTHYVEAGTAMDKEAYDRATSVYLVDRVCPMFPEKLSNEVCSLRPNEDKLCFSTVFQLDTDGKVHNVWYGRTVIHSNKRFHYAEAQDVLDGKTDGPFAEELNTLNSIARKLRKARMKDGAIAFETQELRFELDEKGKPIGIKVKEHLETNELIEDYMLLANRYVAKYIAQIKSVKTPPANVFRVHDDPDPLKLEQFAEFARKFGHNVKFTDNPVQIATTLNDLLTRVKGKKEEGVLTQLAIRTMAKAYYTTNNIGHYGLGFEYYSHFTSPIRRYPDVMVHRILDEVLRKEKPVLGKEALEEMASHCSLQERSAQTAERESVKFKQVEYMSERIGEEFDGLISGVIARGIFVEITENMCEGFVPEHKLGGFSMDYDEATLSLTDSDTGDRYQFGDKIRVKVVATDLERRTIDFELALQDDEATDDQ